MYKNKDKKKIIFFMPSFEGGGVEKNISLISNYFIKKKLNVSLITASKHAKKNINNSIKFISPKNSFWGKYGRPLKYLICIFLLYKEYKNNRNFKVFSFQGNIICIIFCKLLDIKIVIRPNSSPSGWSNSIFKKFIFSKIFSWSDKIIVNSLEFKKELKKKFNLNSIYIYNPLNILEIKKLSKKKIIFKFFNKNNLNLISIGRLVHQKDHLCLLKAINLLKKDDNIKLLIFGDGYMKNSLIKFIKKNKLEKIIKIKDRVENPYPYILKSDVMILTSRFEGLPNVLLEGLALNKFIMSTDCPTGPKEILDNGRGGILFRIGDYIQLAKNIKNYNRKKREMIKLKKHGIKRLNRFNYKKNLNNYYYILNNL